MNDKSGTQFNELDYIDSEYFSMRMVYRGATAYGLYRHSDCKKCHRFWLSQCKVAGSILSEIEVRPFQ